MKPVCVIPARGGSKGVPRKNIRLIAGKPLLAYTIEASLKSNIFSHVFVNTEDREIANIAKKYGAEVPFIRPISLSNDTAPMDAVLLHAVKKLYSLGYEFDIFVWRDCTVPFIRDVDIVGSINLLKKKKCEVVCGVYKQHLNPYYNILEVSSRGFLKLSKGLNNRPRSRQEAPIVYQENGLHTYDAKQFLKFKRTYLTKSVPHIIPIETGLMIDTEFEFQIAKMLIERKFFELRNKT